MTIKPSPRLAGSVRRVLVAVGLGATLVLGSAGAASAGTWSFNDPTKDVYGGSNGGSSVISPDRAVGDVQRLAVSHTNTKLIVRVTFRQGLPSKNWSIFETIRTPVARFALLLHRYDGAGIQFYNFSADNHRARCRGLAVTYAPRSVQISIPTRCLGSPRVVKVGATVDTAGPNFYYSDDALLPGFGVDGPRLSPQIPRG